MTQPYAPPRETGVGSRLLRLRLPRFLRLYAVALPISAVLFACWETIKLMFTAGPNLQAHAAQFVFHDGIRRTAPFANAVALVLALVLWTDRQRPDRLTRRRGRILRQSLVAFLPAYLLGSSIAIFTGLAVLLGPFGQSTLIVSLGAGIVTPWDFWTGLQSTILDALVIVVLAHIGLARWRALNLALPLKVFGALSIGAAAHLWLASLVL